MIRGFNNQTNLQAANAEVLLNVGRTVLYDRIDYRIQKLASDTINLITYRIDEQLNDTSLFNNEKDVLRELRVAFDTVRYRTDFIWNTELSKAYNFGRLLGIRFLNQYGFQLIAHPDSCEQCQMLDGRIILANNADIEDVPPFHPSSRMKFEVLKTDPNLSVS